MTLIVIASIEICGRVGKLDTSAGANWVLTARQPLGPGLNLSWGTLTELCHQVPLGGGIQRRVSFFWLPNMKLVPDDTAHCNARNPNSDSLKEGWGGWLWPRTAQESFNCKNNSLPCPSLTLQSCLKCFAWPACRVPGQGGLMPHEWGSDNNEDMLCSCLVFIAPAMFLLHTQDDNEDVDVSIPLTRENFEATLARYPIGKRANIAKAKCAGKSAAHELCLLKTNNAKAKCTGKIAAWELCLLRANEAAAECAGTNAAHCFALGWIGMGARVP
eukprot:1144119-Pelagomonas_calceolata.AAC.4